MNYAFWADVLVTIHFLYVSFVVGGLLLILLGLLRGWRWVRNPWFRIIHLLAILFVASEAVLGITCPLTTWEWDLRELAGEEVSHTSFVGRIFDNLLFYQGVPEWFFRILHIGFGLLVLGTFILAPPRFKKKTP